VVNETEITEVRIRLATRDAGNIVAWASCLLCGGLILNNIEILRGRDGNSWINFPSRPSRRGKAMHFFYPVNHRTRAVFEKAILDAYASQAGISRAGSSEKRKG
jgi:DNA-binding cell septation regulator SpoVG